MSVIVSEQTIRVDGSPIRHLTAGEGTPLVLLHALGESALDWRWVMPALARTHSVYAPDLPGFGDSAKPAASYSPAFFASFVAAYLDALGVDRAAVAGNSLGGHVALRLALSEPGRVGALALVGSAGLGRRVSFALRAPTVRGYGDIGIYWGKTSPGATQRTWLKARLIFANTGRVPTEWLEEQYRLARLPGFLEAGLKTLRAQIGLRGQREVLLERLSDLTVPTLVVWGNRDRVVPVSQARDAVARLRDGSLEVISDCGHLPQVERPEQFVAALGRFLDERAYR